MWKLYMRRGVIALAALGLLASALLHILVLSHPAVESTEAANYSNIQSGLLLTGLPLILSGLIAWGDVLAAILAQKPRQSQVLYDPRQGLGQYFGKWQMKWIGVYLSVGIVLILYFNYLNQASKETGLSFGQRERYILAMQGVTSIELYALILIWTIAMVQYSREF